VNFFVFKNGSKYGCSVLPPREAGRRLQMGQPVSRMFGPAIRAIFILAEPLNQAVGMEIMLAIKNPDLVGRLELLYTDDAFLARSGVEMAYTVKRGLQLGVREFWKVFAD
jgi:hypothetical protein